MCLERRRDFVTCLNPPLSFILRNFSIVAYFVTAQHNDLFFLLLSKIQLGNFLFLSSSSSFSDAAFLLLSSYYPVQFNTWVIMESSLIHD